MTNQLDKTMREIRQWEADNLPGEPRYHYASATYERERLIPRELAAKLVSAMICVCFFGIVLLLCAALGLQLSGVLS